MRIDFREERKWKLSVAYSLAHAALDWHHAGTAEERDRLGICVRWVPQTDEPADQAPLAPEVDMPLGLPGQPEVQEPVDQALLDYASDQSDDDNDHDVDDALEAGAIVEAALDTAEQPKADFRLVQATDDVQPKTEDIEDTSALRNSGDSHGMLVDKAEEDSVEPLDDTTQPKQEDNAALNATALRPMSTNPMMGEVTGDQKAQGGKSTVYAPLREKIAYSADDLLFLDDDFVKLVITAPSDGEERLEDPESTTPDLLTIFSDLQPLDLLDIAPALAPSDGKKKSDRKSDKDDPHKRAEDTTYMRLTPMSQFMSIKPTLLGPLNPAEHWKNGQWIGLEDTPVTIDSESGPSKSADENPCGMFIFVVFRPHT